MKVLRRSRQVWQRNEFQQTCCGRIDRQKRVVGKLEMGGGILNICTGIPASGPEGITVWEKLPLRSNNVGTVENAS